MMALAGGGLPRKGRWEETHAYTRKQWALGVSIAAVPTWSAVSAPLVLQAGAWLLPWAAVIGLPIAFLGCWCLGAPILARVMRRTISWRAAAGWGAVISTVIAAVGIAIGRFQGWQASRDPHFNFQSGGGDFVREVDGVLTSYGWWVLAQNTALFILAGMLTALVVRWVIGPGKKAA